MSAKFKSQVCFKIPLYNLGFGDFIIPKWKIKLNRKNWQVNLKIKIMIMIYILNQYNHCLFGYKHVLHARFMLFYVNFKIGKKTRLLSEKLLYNLEFGIEIENINFKEESCCCVF